MLSVTARTRAGHPWVFSNEVISPPVSALPNGGAVEVRDPKGNFLGRGYANPHSLISIRMFANERDDIDDSAFYVARLTAALQLRQRVLPGRGSYRLCAGEADRLPGLVIDRYGSVVSVQMTTLGMDQRADLVRDALEQVVAPDGAVLRNDVPLRQLEDLPLTSRVWFGNVPERVAFDENGIRFEADLVHGQKTGFFFDQADNRAFMRARAKDARVLDVYAHLGGWALAGMLGDAKEAIAIESSAAACEMIKKNAALNDVSVTVEQADAQEAMAEMPARGFDIVAVDPPAFAKTRKTAGPALHLYKQVNAAGLRLVAEGGLYFTSSCSHHIQAERFEETVLHAGRQAGRRLTLVRRGGQAPDHPILPGVPETEYLKHLVFVVR